MNLSARVKSTLHYRAAARADGFSSEVINEFFFINVFLLIANLSYFIGTKSDIFVNDRREILIAEVLLVFKDSLDSCFVPTGDSGSILLPLCRPKESATF